MRLDEYRKKRDFNKTDEPKGSKKKSKNLFVVQKHDASNLHYDFRIELDGVLKSWAIPKGPSYDPSVKRLAMPTEDHPLDYADFEGVIPEGEYGAGTVMVWDKGTYRNLDEKSLMEGYKKGHIKLELKGKKLKGGFALINMRARKGWLFMKIKDDHADKRKNPVNSEPKSAKSGKTLEQIKNG